MLPSAFVAAGLLEIVVNFIQHLAWGTGDMLATIGLWWAQGFVLVLAGTAVAPAHKFYASVGLAICGGLAVGALSIMGLQEGDAIGWLILRGAMSCAGFLFGCMVAHAWQLEVAKEELNREISKQPHWGN